MVKINNNLKEKPCFLYDGQDNLVGEIKNNAALNDVRIQIKKSELEGYYIIFENFILGIDKNGNVGHWPKGFFDLFDKQLDELLK